jgi:hypothetical protein
MGRGLACLVMLLGAWSCYSEDLLYDRPPPPREERVETRDGYVFVHGHWEQYNVRWLWHEGHYEKLRPGFEYVEGHWEPHCNNPNRCLYGWVEGGWRSVSAAGAQH